jgi:glycosyltransferase involved in cell wall biosynthesis
MRCPALNELVIAPPERRGWPWTEESPPAEEIMSNGNPWPRVSIVTPSFNQGQFIEATIRSVLLQGYPNLEYIIIDGGSTDGSVEVIRKYEDSVAYWVSEQDQGQSDAINKGWKLARGEIVAYLNSDDLYLPGTVSRVVRHFLAHPDISVVYGSHRLLNAASEVMREEVIPPDWSESVFIYCFPQPTSFFRRDTLHRIGNLDTSFHYSMDYDFFVRLALAGERFSRVPGPPLAAVRIWEGAKSSNRSERGAAEDFRIIARAAVDPRLPQAVRDRLPYIKAHACLWPAYEYYLRGEMRSARRLLSRARILHGGIVTRWEFLGLYARTLLGRRGSRILRKGKQRLARGLRRVRG